MELTRRGGQGAVPRLGSKGQERPLVDAAGESAVMGSIGSTKAPLVRVHGRNALALGMQRGWNSPLAKLGAV
jgi:hypothetical protein